MLTHIKRKDSATALHGNANSTKILSFQKIIYCPNLQTLKPSCINLKWYNLIESMSHGKFPSLTSQALSNSCIPNHLKKLWGELCLKQQITIQNTVPKLTLYLGSLSLDRCPITRSISHSLRSI